MLNADPIWRGMDISRSILFSHFRNNISPIASQLVFFIRFLRGIKVKFKLQLRPVYRTVSAILYNPV